VGDPFCIEAMLCSLCERVCWRARKRGVKARTVTLKLRYADFQTLSRSRTLTPTHSEQQLLPVVRALFRGARTRKLAIRLLGVCLSNLGPHDRQLELFDGPEALHRAVDGLRERYGYESLNAALSSWSPRARRRAPPA
jgi:DNA polymerase-4